MLKQIRLSVGLSSIDMQKKYGITKSAIYRIENGNNGWTIENELAYLRALLHFRENYSLRFKEIREKLHLSGREVAQLTGIHRTTVRRLEKPNGNRCTVDVEFIYSELWRRKKSALVS